MKVLEINKIYNMDCLIGLKQILDDSVDCIITDPPYPMDTENGTNRFKYKVRNIKGSKENYLTDKNLKWFSLSCPWRYLWPAALKQFLRVLKPGGHVYIFINENNLFKEKYKIDKYFKFRSLLVWYKGTSFNECNGLGYHWRKNCEYIYYYTKGKTKRYIQNHGTLLHYPRNEIKINHPTPKSDKLIRQLLLKSTDEGDLVLDAFIGSGTTAVACKQLRRNFIGFEIDPNYCKIAEARLNQQILTPFLKK